MSWLTIANAKKAMTRVVGTHDSVIVVAVFAAVRVNVIWVGINNEWRLETWVEV